MTTNSKKRSDIEKTSEFQNRFCRLHLRFGMFQIFGFENEINTWNAWIGCNKGTAVQNELLDVHSIGNRSNGIDLLGYFGYLEFGCR